MKTTEEILAIHSSNYNKTVEKDEKPLYFLSLNGHEAINAMKEYAREAIKEDRKNVAEHAKIKEDYFDRYEEHPYFQDWHQRDFTYERRDGDGDGDVYGIDVCSIDKDSIIIAPNIELK